MKTSKSHFTARPKLLVYSIASALALPAPQAIAANLAQTPFYLQNETTTSTNDNFPKPNVMLFIDDSGSMDQKIGRQKKIDITKNALYGILDEYKDKINWGLQTLHNNTSDKLRPNMPGFTDKWQDVKRNIALMYPYKGTPTTRRYYDVQQIVRDKLQYRCQKSYIVLMSDGDANTSCRSSTGDNFNYWGDPHFGNQAGGQCLWDRNSNGYYDTVWDANDGLRFFSQTLATKDFKDIDGSSGNKYWNGNPDDLKGSDGQSIYKNQLIETFTIGFGDGLAARGRRYLRRGASQDDYFFNASDSEGLEAAFAKIFETIGTNSKFNASNSYGTVSPAVMGSAVPGMAAVTRLDTGSWSSQLHFYDVNDDGSVDVNSEPKQPSFSNRKTLINTGSQTYAFPGTVAGVNNAYFNTSGSTPTDQNEWLEALLPWTARSGNDASIAQLADSRAYSQKYRIRAEGTRDLGDILDSPISPIGDSIGGRQEFLVTAANDGMVHLFQSDALESATHPYDLKLSYIPAGMQRGGAENGGTTLAATLKELAHPDYGQNSTYPHRYMVNGGFTLRRTPALTTSGAAAKGQQIFMVGAMGQGGRGAYALNIGGRNRTTGTPLGLNSASTQWASEVPLFETAKGTANTLGYTIGTPQIGRVSLARTDGTVDLNNNIRYAAFLASGFRNPADSTTTQETALYIYDALAQEAGSGANLGTEKGRLIRKITVNDGIGGLSSPTVVDINFDGVADIVYAGDYGGNMYRFDLRGNTPTNWSVNKIYAGKTSQPITAAPAISRREANKYVVIFGTGSDIYQEDLTNRDQQSVYGIFDDVSPTANTLEAAVDTELQTQTFTAVADGKTDYRFLSTNPITASHRGWKIDLENNGERIVTKPTMILRTAVVSSRIYQRVQTRTNTNTSSDVCLSNTSTSTITTSSWLTSINAETGGALTNRDAYIDFRMTQNSADGTIQYANGMRELGLISFTYSNPDQVVKTTTADGDAGGDGSVEKGSTTADGDAGGDGTDDTLRPDGKAGKNNCFANPMDRLLYTGVGGNNAASPILAYDIEGPLCKSTLKRISWREIF